MRGFALVLVLLVTGIASGADPLPPGAVLRLGETKFRAGGEVQHLQFSPYGTVLMGWVVGLDGQLHPVAWETATGVLITLTGAGSPPDVPERTTAAARLTGDRVVTAGPGCAGRVWDASTGRQLALLSGHSALVTAVAVSRDGKRIATGSADGLIKVWDADSFHPLTALGGHTGVVRTIRVAFDGSRAVTTGDDRSARVWDLKNGKELRGFPTTEPVEFTPDGTAVVMSASGRTVVRDILTGLEVVPAHQPSCPTHTIPELLSQIGLSVAFSPDGRMVAAAHRDGTIGLYETATGQQRRKLVGHRSVCGGMAFTPDGTHLLTAGADHSVLVWAVRVQDLPMPETIQRETRAGKLWTMLTTDRADTAYLAMARFAAEPPAAVKMARLRLRPAEAAESDPEDQLAIARGVELLESLGTIAAMEFLEELASGEPTAHRTREARRALERLGGKW
jgi:WD40 repeat protein